MLDKLFYLELLPFNWWTWASILLKSTVCWSRANERALRSFSESSKKRDTTSRTKSGLLSSCSCWSCENWSSKNPFCNQKPKDSRFTNQKSIQQLKPGIKHELEGKTVSFCKVKANWRWYSISSLRRHAVISCIQENASATDPAPSSLSLSL